MSTTSDANDEHAGDMPTRLLSAEAVAAWLGVNYRTVLDYIAAGDLPHVPIGRRKLVRADDLGAFIDARTVRGAD
jgi:excisionase family DNA binding protein